MPNFSLGLSALRTNQYALEVVSNNIANANTEGYHRRSVHLESLAPNQVGRFRVGNGVGVNHIERIRNQVTEASLTNVISDVRHVDQLLEVERQIEYALLSGNTSVGHELDQFFSELTKLTAAPDEPAQRSAVIETGQRMAGIMRQSSVQLAELKTAVKFQISQEVDALNQKMQLLSDLSIEIQSLTAQGFQPNTELDQRDALVNEIAEVIGITRNDYFSTDLNLMVGHASIQQSNSANQFSILQQADGELGIVLDESEQPVNVGSGRLVALLEVYNSTIPKYEDKLDQLAVEMMHSFDSVHATGVGTDGPFQHLAGTRAVVDSNIPLAIAGTTFPIEAGELIVSILDPDGTRRTEAITIDPSVDSLQDVAARIKAIDGLNAAVNPTSGQLQIFATDGVRFDFTGTVQTHPNLDNFNGTSLPSFSGTYSGSTNREFRFEIEGTGEVGIAEDLFLNVYTETGALQNRVNIGRGYEAGSDIDLGDGMQIAMARGSVEDGDQFATRLIAEPDETGVLAALGLNSFFRGVNAKTIQVDAKILENPGRFAAGRSSDSADTANLFRLTALEDANDLPGNLSLSEFVSEINTEIGFQINTDAALSSSLHSLQNRLEQDRDAYSGVDLNEEMVYLQQYQKSYEAAVRVIQAADEILNELFAILG